MRIGLVSYASSDDFVSATTAELHTCTGCYEKAPHSESGVQMQYTTVMMMVGNRWMMRVTVLICRVALQCITQWSKIRFVNCTLRLQPGGNTYPHEEEKTHSLMPQQSLHVVRSPCSGNNGTQGPRHLDIQCFNCPVYKESPASISTLMEWTTPDLCLWILKTKTIRKSQLGTRSNLKLQSSTIRSFQKINSQ